MDAETQIAVIFPSRGLFFSRTAEELLNNLEGHSYDLFFAHGLPIPDCFEKPLQQALRGSYTHIWFVEDDMILPPGTLDSMLALDAPVVACDYPVSKTGQGAIFKTAEGKIIFAGTGCLLVQRAVFNALNPPYFRTDIRWNATNYGSFIRLTANQITNPSLEGYGLHDTNFGLKLWQAGIPISEAGKLGQRKLIALGKPGTNDGAHQIEEWTKLKPNYLYRKFKRMPAQPLGKLIPVMTREGELMVHPDHAKKLIRAGIATKPPRQSVAIDYNELEI